MAYDYSKIDVPKIEGVADQMSQLNGQLREKLEEARRLIEILKCFRSFLVSKGF